MPEQTLSVNELQKVRLKVAKPIIALAGVSVYGFVTFLSLTSFEAGKVDSISLIAPVKYCYEKLGLYGALLPFLILGLFFIFRIIKAKLYEKEIIELYGQEEFDLAAAASRKKVPKFLSGADDKGKMPKRTKILGLIWISIIVLIVVGVKLGYIT